MLNAAVALYIAGSLLLLLIPISVYYIHAVNRRKACRCEKAEVAFWVLALAYHMIGIALFVTAVHKESAIIHEFWKWVVGGYLCFDVSKPPFCFCDITKLKGRVRFSRMP